jgi:hypothetical protein
MFRRVTTYLTAFAVLFLITAAPASAASSYISRTTGTAADAYWTQIDGTPVGTGAFGNVHIGYLSAYETSKGKGDVFVYIDDFDCEEGETPYGGHGVEEEGVCDYIGSRWGEGYDLAFTIDKKLNSASLVGSVTMTQGGGHGDGGAVVGSPAVDMTWSGYGNTIKDSYSYRYNDGDSTYMDRYKATYRQATLGGSIGPMTFAPDLSGGTMSTFSSFSKGRTP